MRTPSSLLLIGLGLASASCGAVGAGVGTPHVTLESDAKLLPARTRRLTNLEVERSVATLTGLPVALANELPPDVRQEGYTPNANQDVSSTWASRYGGSGSDDCGARRQRASGAGQLPAIQRRSVPFTRRTRARVARMAPPARYRRRRAHSQACCRMPRATASRSKLVSPCCCARCSNRRAFCT